MKKMKFLYIPLLLAGILLTFGSYIIISWLILNYNLVREENIRMDISIVLNDTSNEAISRILLNKWLSEFKKEGYISNKIDDYVIHNIILEEEHDNYFIFSAQYSIVTNNTETAWKNAPHVEQDGFLTFDRKFRVNKVGNKYYFRTVVDATDVDFTK